MPARRPKRGTGGSGDLVLGPIVSSKHLASEHAPELSELEFSITIANNSFQRWILSCMTASGVSELGTLDILVLHGVNRQDRERKLTEICFILNIDDVHTVSYALRKLKSLGLVSGKKVGKENYFFTTKDGAEVCERYRQVREECLIKSLEIIEYDNKEIGNLARLLRVISGLYDQAARAATSI